jgi:hypothetical protein
MGLGLSLRSSALKDAGNDRIHELANGSKHFNLRDKYDDQTISSYRTASVSFYLSDNGEERSVPTHGVFIEDGDRIYSDLGLFSRAHDYWQEFFERYGVS